MGKKTRQIGQVILTRGLTSVTFTISAPWYLLRVFFANALVSPSLYSLFYWLHHGDHLRVPFSSSSHRNIKASPMNIQSLTAIITLSLTQITQADPQQITTLKIGSAAPEFSLKGTDGKTYTLASFKDAKYLVAIFTCNHCPDARASRDRINQFAKDYADKGVKVVAISSSSPQGLIIWENAYSVYGDSYEEMKLVAKEHNYTFPYLYDGDEQKASLAYGAIATPHTFIFGPERKLHYQGHFDNGRRDPGPASQNTVKNAIDNLIAGKPIANATTRVFGCSTKWKWKSNLVEKYQKEWAALPVTVEPLDAKLAKTLAENKTDKMRLINLWSTTCGPCIAEFPALIDTYQRHQIRPFELITIAIDPKDDAVRVQKFLKEKHLPLSKRTLKSVEAEGRKTNNYHYQGDDLDNLATAIDPDWKGPIPHTILVAPGGKIVYRHSGQVDEIELRRVIIKAMADAKMR